MKLILASASPRRQELIKSLNLEVEVIPSNADENICEADAEKYVMSLAQIKAKSVFEKTRRLTLGADTVVEIGGEILGKPKTPDMARLTLRKLCGRTHRVLTGFCFVWEGGVITDREITFVTFRDYDSNIIEEYITSGSPFDKAGGYGIQDKILSPLIEKVDGDINNVIGLPLQKIGHILKEKFGTWT